jgi:acyl-CoA synthetase (NDP forming)
MHDINLESLDYFFYPQNIVIFEASEKLEYFFDGLKKQNFDRNKIYPISSTLEEVFGFKTYNTINDIPEEKIDLLILAVNKVKLVNNLKEFLKEKEIKAIHIFTAGTGETGEEGLDIERELLKILMNDKNHPRAIGPNCMGVYCPKGHVAYSPDFPAEPGNIGLIFQSGDMHTKLIKYGDLRFKLRFSKGVSVGNTADLQISDFLQYFNNDEDTDIIGVYFEGFSKIHPIEGKNLFMILKTMKKPVLFMNGAKTTRAQTAASSHTGSIGSNQMIWKGILKQTPIIEVPTDLDEMIDYIYIFYNIINRYKLTRQINKGFVYPQGKRALIILWSGGFGIISTNTLTELGFEVPHFKDETLENLKKIYPLRIGSLSNPLDLPWMVHTNEFFELSKAAISNNIDLVIIVTDAWNDLENERFIGYYNNLKKIKEHVEKLDKIFMIILPEYYSESRKKFYEMLVRDNFIIYPSVRTGAKSFLALYEYGKKINKSIK